VTKAARSWSEKRGHIVFREEYPASDEEMGPVSNQVEVAIPIRVDIDVVPVGVEFDAFASPEE
jgi:hypothetical protein